MDRSNPVGRGVKPLLTKLICCRKSGQDLEDSLVLCPIEQQDWFSNRHLFDLVVIYDEESRVNTYAGGPVRDIHQSRLRNLTVAIFDYAGYRKSLKHVPVLLIGGIRAWCNLVREHPLRLPTSNKDADATVPVTQAHAVNRNSTNHINSIERRGDEIDLDSEVEWYLSASCNFNLLRNKLQPAAADAPDRQMLHRFAKKYPLPSPLPPPSPSPSSLPSSDPYNKSILDFVKSP